MALAVGDKVRVIKEKAEGVITRAVDDLKVMVDIDGFEFPYWREELVKVEEEHEIEELIEKGMEDSSVIEEITDSSQKKSKKTKSEKSHYREVDLHMHELLDNTSGMDSGEKLRYQLDHCVKQLEEAFKNREQKVVIIHGVGEGVLRAEVRKVLDQYSHLEYHDASYGKYGVGATEVIIRQNY